MKFDKSFNAYLNKVNDAVFKYLPKTSEPYSYICDAMEYSLESGGKRIRPVLLLAFCDLCGGDLEKALPFAASLEYIHTYSLIHDDLPCMDNDDMRRGQPSSHIKFGEANALLAGDALLTHAFSAMQEAYELGLAPDLIVRATKALSDRAGVMGMIGGQYLDLSAENDLNAQSDLDYIKKMVSLKTCELIKAACQLACIVAGADEEKAAAAISYGQNLGMAFQIRDDILDVTATEEDLGKPIGSDAENNKSTFLSILGKEGAEKLAEEYTQKALNDLSFFDGDTSFLKELTERLLNRKS